MAFQAPYDIVGMRNQMMREDLARQEQQQQYMGMITGALGDLANMYQKQEEMKAGVKAGEQMLKMFGGQLGIDSKILSSPEYKAMGMRGQAALHGNLWGSLGAISNMRMANARFGLQQQAPFVDQYLDTQNDIASGNRTFTPTGGGGMPAPVEPPLPTDEPMDTLPPVQSSPAAPAASMPGGAQSREALNRWRASQGLPPI